MIDALYARYSLSKEKPLDPNYKPSDAIQRRILLNEGAGKLAVIFPGWHTHNFPVDVLAKRLVRKGWAVMYYDFHDQILEPDEDLVVESFRYIRDTIIQDMEKLLAKKTYEELRLISISMGGVLLALVADKFPHFTGATAVVGGDNLAIDMWHGLRTKPYAKQFQKMHVGVRRLAKEWETVSPEAHLGHFKNKPVKFVMSRHDKFVLTKYQEKLLEKLIRTGAQVKVKKHWVGHTLTIILFAYFDSPL